jgi:hypothetical protein
MSVLCSHERTSHRQSGLAQNKKTARKAVSDMCKSLRMTDEMHRAHIGRAMRRLEALS